MPCSSTLTLAVCKERTAWLTLSHKTYNTAYIPCLAGIQCGVTHPVTHHRNYVAVVDSSDVGRIYIISIDTHRSLKTCKYLVAQQYSTTSVAHNNGSRLSLAVVYGINHRLDVIHAYILV